VTEMKVDKMNLFRKIRLMWALRKGNAGEFRCAAIRSLEYPTDRALLLRVAFDNTEAVLSRCNSINKLPYEKEREALLRLAGLKNIQLCIDDYKPEASCEQDYNRSVRIAAIQKLDASKDGDVLRAIAEKDPVSQVRDAAAGVLKG